MQLGTEEREDAITSMNREIDDMCTDPIIFVDIENDLKDVERDFSDDTALEAFKAKYEVRIHAEKLLKFSLLFGKNSIAERVDGKKFCRKTHPLGFIPRSEEFSRK